MKLIRLVLLAVVAPVCLFQGCDDASNEALPNSGQSLCIDLYENCVDPLFHNATNTGNSCSQPGCHNPPTGQDSFFLYPTAMANQMPVDPLMLNNFNQVQARTLNNDLLLSKATGNAHGGGAQFNVGDNCYNTIAEWRAIIAPTDGSACTATISTCAAIMANAALLVGGCGP